MKSTCTRRDFLAGLSASAAALTLAPHLLADELKDQRPNVLLITADDMDYYSLGVLGCKVPDVTPNMNALAAQGMRFEHAHVTSAICQPCRSVLMTGRYPHRNGAQGFEPINPDVPTLQESLQAAGYMNGIMAKTEHLMPRSKFCWDSVMGAVKLGAGRNPDLYYEQAKTFFEQAKTAGKPFFLMANSQDPHRPYPDSDKDEARGLPKASRCYTADEIEVPGFLPQDVPDIKKEIAQYFTAVHRCDEAVGQVLRALKETGLEDDTLVMFLSDNGISTPFAKTNCYEYSTRTPLIVRWPGKVKAGKINKNDFVSGIDFMPTVLDAVGAKSVDGLDGRSFVPLLSGKKQKGRDKVFTFITKTAAKNEFPMRSVRTKNFSYIYNAWPDGKKVFVNEAQSGLTFKAMQSADGSVAERANFFLYRVPEELYNLKDDPYEMKNLIGDPERKGTIDKMRAEMLKMMTSTGDPLLDAFKKQIGKS